MKSSPKFQVTIDSPPDILQDLKSETNQLRVMPTGDINKFGGPDLTMRPHTANPYQLTAKYRTCGTRRRVKSGNQVSRRKRCNESRAESGDRAGSVLSATTSTDANLYGFDGTEDFDFDGDDSQSSSRQTPRQIYSHSQLVYLRVCRDMKILATTYVLKSLNSDRMVLKHHILGPEGTKTCAVALVENSSIQVLDLEDNDIGVKGAKYIAEMLNENNFITELRLADNNLGREGVKCILDAMLESDCIRVLDLSGNNLQENDAELFTKIIEESHNLKQLYLHHNSFRQRGGVSIGEAIGWNDTLEVLDLSWNHLRLQGAAAIAKGIAINDGIKVLNLAWNGLYKDGCKEIAKSLERNSTLEELNLNANRINKACLAELLKGLKNNKILKVLKLSNNPITSNGALYLLKNITETNTSGLRDIDLGYQSVDPEFERIYEEFKDSLGLSIKYGSVLGQDGKPDDDEEELVNENPVVILMEFGKLMGLRLIDLFSMMDKDNSKTLTRIEIKQGLSEANIPLSDKSLDKLVHRLDTDGDGEIDYGELMAGKEIHRRKLTKTIMMSRDEKIAMEDTEVGRVREILLRLTSKHRKRGMKSGFSALAGLQTDSSKQADSLKLPGKASERRRSIIQKD